MKKTPNATTHAAPSPSTAPQYSIGIDYHKRYSVYCALDAAGEIQARGRISHATPGEFAALVKKWPGRVVFEASMNWHWLYELLEREMPAEDILLAHPYKTRIIAETQVKTDSRAERDRLAGGQPAGRRGVAPSTWTRTSWLSC